MNYVLGIDGGGTHTRALLADNLGMVIARGIGPASNPRAVGMPAAAAAIQAAAASALTAAGLPSTTPWPPPVSASPVSGAPPIVTKCSPGPNRSIWPVAASSSPMSSR
ncbi:MAG: hypothetical protein HC822_14935 [Oscillochloris sp.]|nr:hypothetical protein [Oscillochloris sp.]